MAIITNRATVTYSYGGINATASSNVAVTTLTDLITASKTSLGATYTAGDEITYILSVTNGSICAVSDIIISDDLGTYTLGTVSVTPLSYTGPAYLYINGIFNSELNPTVSANSVVFSLPSVPAGANAMVIYRAKIENTASLVSGSTITNTATFSSVMLDKSLTESNTVTVENYARLNIVKAMSPNPVTGGGQLTYTFTIYNYGNDDATDVVLTDVFSPVPTDISVFVNGVTVSPGDYTYTGGTLTLPAAMGTSFEITVPAAEFTTDPTTGIVTITPGITTVEVKGTI